MSAPWPDIAGRLIEDGSSRWHILPVRVYFEDTDFSGLVYHASYLRWIERGRSDYLRLLGIHHAALFAGKDGGEPAAFVVRRMQLEFLRPARIDEVLEVETRAGTLTKATLELLQMVAREGEILFSASVLVALVSASGRPLRLPAAIAAAFRP